MDKIFQKKIEDYLFNLEESPLNWDVKSVCTWFSEIVGLPQYTETIKKKMINGKKLLKLTTTDESIRINLGVEKIGTRKFLLKIIQKLCKKFNLVLSPVLERDFSDQKVFKEKISDKIYKPKKTNSLPEYTSTSPKDKHQLNRSSTCGAILFQEEQKVLMKKNVSDWKNEEILVWLKKNQLEDYFSIFKANSIRGDILLDLNEQLLGEMGIKSVGTIKRIILSLDQLRQQSKPIQQQVQQQVQENNCSPKTNHLNSQPNENDLLFGLPNWSVFQVCQFFSKIGMETYSKAIIKNKIDGDVLLGIDQNDLEELGIKSVGHKKKILNLIQLYKISNK